MSNTVVTSSHPEKLRREITAVLNRIPGAATEAFKNAGKKAGKNAVKVLKSTAPKRTGKSSKAWALKQDGSAFIVHSKSPYHSIPQFLETGHKKLNGGSTQGFNYIAPVERQAVEEFEKEFEKELAKELEAIVR